jgi:hypothetical protein
LRYERLRRQNDGARAFCRRVQEVLANNYAGFDGLAQSDFICEQIALHWICQHAANYLELVINQLDGRRECGRDTRGCHVLKRDLAREGAARVSEKGRFGRFADQQW